MARIGGFTERRQLRRAADQALMSVFAQPLAAPPSDLHLETLPEEPVLAAPNRELPPVEPEPAPAEPPEVGIPTSEGERDTERDDPDATPPFGFAMPLDDVVQWAAISTIDVPPAEATALRRPFYRSPAVMGAALALALAVVAIAVAALLLVAGRNTDAGPGQQTAGPTAPSAAPTPSSAAPAPSASAPPPAALPAEPPAPPVASAPEAPPVAAPQYPQYPQSPRRTAPPPQQGPAVDVTRTPFSAPAPPPQSPQYNQGDGRRAPRRGCCGF